jgi:ribosomal protein S18 acetylase RimI-like enzyme
MSDIIFYRSATPADANDLATLRLAFLAEIAGGKPDDTEMHRSLKYYFETNIASKNFAAFLALAGEKIIASSGMTYHHHPPSNKNPTGREAYIMNMYTLPEYRRRGIATRLLEMLIDEARQNQCGKVSLHVLTQGRSIYANAGFEPIATEMRLNLASS